MKVTTGFNQKGCVIMEYALTSREIQILEIVERNNNFIKWRAGARYSEDRVDDTGQVHESEASDLIAHDFLEPIDNAWHRDYRLSDTAKQFLAYRRRTNPSE